VWKNSKLSGFCMAAKVAQGMVPAVVAVGGGLSGGRVKGGLQQGLHSFVKKVLLQQLVPAGAVVCDLFCGRGTETENWARAGIGKYVGVGNVLSLATLEGSYECVVLSVVVVAHIFLPATAQSKP
jgi:hypothetical protein